MLTELIYTFKLQIGGYSNAYDQILPPDALAVDELRTAEHLTILQNLRGIESEIRGQ